MLLGGLEQLPCKFPTFALDNHMLQSQVGFSKTSARMLLILDGH